MQIFITPALIDVPDLPLLVRIGAVWQLAFYSHDENKFDQIFNHIMKLEFFQKLNCV